MRGAFSLGKIFGIQFRLHYTWFLIFILITLSLVYPNWSQPLSWGMGILTSLLLFASVLAHEMLEQGVYVISFSYPVVPKDKARIRTQMSAAHEKHHLDKAIAAFEDVGKALQVIP